MTRKPKAQHVFINSLTSALKCHHCGDVQPYYLPMSFDVFIAMAEAHGRLHERCKPKADPDATPPVPVITFKKGGAK